ncbi:TPA: hypothetical protein N0F65_008393 [Lagenidium giganteum]|uniref:Phosphoribosyltransferase domain-containing protein n=1 Tax=Lagenidium giganteum TaxID=4803 RepID=A0AAV2Z0F5_9STRA|nr:TPA: hypothetical protein N0F65_008393 [Lagenidium giganteum]
MQDIDQFFVRDHQDAMTLKSESFPVSAPSPSDHMLVTPQAPIKNSRYLREIDRRIILSRIERGEKQAALAKEYQVSRAAICNLKKHRDEVMSRTDENPLAKHPKKPRPRVPQPRNSRSTRDSDDESGVHELKTRSMALLLTTLRNKNTSLIEFRRCAERILRLLVEEALAIAPIKKVEVWMNDDEKMKGFGMEQPPCAISMEQNGCPLLDIFHLVEPEQPTGYVRIDANEEEAARRITILDAHLPASLNNHSVLIFDVASTCPKAVLTVIQRLLSRGAVAKSIFLVTLFVYPDVIAMVHTNHPTVQIVTAQIDPTLLQPAKVAAADGNAPRISRLALFLRRLADAYHSNDATAYRVGDATDSSEPPQSTASVAIHDHDPRNWETPISEV